MNEKDFDDEKDTIPCPPPDDVMHDEPARQSENPKDKS